MTRSDPILRSSCAWSVVLAVVVLGYVTAAAQAVPDLRVSQVDGTAVTGDWQTLMVGGQVAVT
ncbi:MAG: hypothetical protein ACE5GE_16935, partial [Phycisphaerae bacterium]